MITIQRIVLSFAIGLFLSESALANVVINGTRFIYQENAKDVTVKLTNNGKSPVLAQAWIDEGDPNVKPDELAVPFTITPPINRINASQSQTLKIRYIGKTLPSDRETLFWLNIHEVPVKPSQEGKNYLQFAFRSRLKFIYRPTRLQGKVLQSHNSLKWDCKGNKCVISNPSPTYVSLVGFYKVSKGKKEYYESDMLAPYDSIQVVTKSTTNFDYIEYLYLNDWGAVKKATYGKP